MIITPNFHTHTHKINDKYHYSLCFIDETEIQCSTANLPKTNTTSKQQNVTLYSPENLTSFMPACPVQHFIQHIKFVPSLPSMFIAQYTGLQNMSPNLKMSPSSNNSIKFLPVELVLVSLTLLSSCHGLCSPDSQCYYPKLPIK